MRELEVDMREVCDYFPLGGIIPLNPVFFYNNPVRFSLGFSYLTYIEVWTGHRLALMARRIH